MNLTYRIAKALYDARVRLEDESGLCALNDKKVTQKIKDDVGQLVLDYGNCIELEITTDRVQAMGAVDALRLAAWEHADEHLTDAVDEELWIIQCGAAADAWVDAAIDQMQTNRSAA